jgi:putative ABC transport system substrate-binding protein
VRRREFIALAGGAAVAWPFAARAQPAMPVIGFLSGQAAGNSAHIVRAFREGLAETGFVEGRNIEIDFRWAEGHYDRLPPMAAEFVKRPVAVIFAASLPSALAAKAATTTIPIVFVMGADPVRLGVVVSLARPGGNITGVSQYYGALGGKRLEQLREIVPAAGTIAVLSNPRNPNAKFHISDIRDAARAMGQPIEIFNAGSENEIEPAFARLAVASGALLVADDPLFNAQRDRLIALAARHAVPTSYYAREFVAAGGLIGYGSSVSDNYVRAARYVGQILRSTNPADLPVLQPTKFELVINLKTARALGITIPPTLLARADEVIE